MSASDAMLGRVAAPLRSGYALVLLWSAAAWALAPLLFGPQGFGDRERYLAIAATPFDFTVSPWGYRVAIPWVARALEELTPLARAGAFELLQFLAFLGCNLLLVTMARDLRVSRALATFALAAFAIGYQFVYYRHNYTHVGLYELLLLGWACRLLYRRRPLALIVTLAASVLVKESVAFVFLQVFVLFLLGERWLGTSRPWRPLAVAGVIAAPLAVFAMVRLAFGPESEAAAGTYLGAYDEELFGKIFDGFPRRVTEYLTVYGVLLLALPFALWRWRTDAFLRLHLLVVVVALDQLLLAVDTRRMAAVATISLVVLTLRLAGRHLRIELVAALLALQCLFGIGWLTQRYAIAVLSLAVGAILCAVAVLRARRASLGEI